MLMYWRVHLYNSVVREATDATTLLFKGLAETQMAAVSNDSIKCLQVFQSTISYATIIHELTAPQLVVDILCSESILSRQSRSGLVEKPDA